MGMYLVVIISVLGGFVLSCVAGAFGKENAKTCLVVISITGLVLLIFGMPWSSASAGTAIIRTICFIIMALCSVFTIMDVFGGKFKSKTQKRVISWSAGCAIFLVLCLAGSVVIPVGDGRPGDGINACRNCGKKLVVSGGLCDTCYISYKNWEFKENYLP